MPHSMTGFATLGGAAQGWSWVWELRAVNGRGLDLRLRLPDRPEGLDQAARSELQKRLARGNVTLSLKLAREEGVQAAELDPLGLSAALAQIRQVEDAARAQDVDLRATSAAEILAMRGVLEASGGDGEDVEALRAPLLADLPKLIESFIAARAAEGEALQAVLTGQVERIAALTASARERAAARAEGQGAALRANLARVMENAEGADPDRVAQELALIAVKQDVTEELDRLDAHVAAARDLVAASGPVGRKLDFLAQEFIREANTLCSKSQSAGLTQVGLDLKTVVDQMREQVQNVE